MWAALLWRLARMRAREENGEARRLVALKVVVEVQEHGEVRDADTRSPGAHAHAQVVVVRFWSRRWDCRISVNFRLYTMMTYAP